MEDIKKKKKCVSPEQLANLELIVRELSVRLTTVEDCLLGLDGMRDRMRHLEKSMESALDRIMPRLDSLLAGLPASVTRQITAKPSIVPLPSSSQPASLASPSSSPNCATSNSAKGKDSCTSKTASYAHLDNSSKKNADPKSRNTSLNGEKQRSTSSAVVATKPATEKKKKNSVNEKETKKVTSAPACSLTTLNEKTMPSSGEGDSCAGASYYESAYKCYSEPSDRRTREFLKGVFAGVLAVVQSRNKSGTLGQHEQDDAEMNEVTAKLQKAALRGDLMACTMLVSKGASVSKRDPVSGDTALLCALRGGHLACISFLMDVVKVTHGVTDVAQSIASSSKQGTASTKAAARKRKTTGRSSTGGKEGSLDSRSQGAAVSQIGCCKGQSTHAGSPATSKVQTSCSTESCCKWTVGRK